MVNTMKSQQSIDVTLSKLEEKAGQFARQFVDISKQSLNSHHDPNLDIENLSNFDTIYTCDPDICVEINFAMPLVSISFAGIKPYPDTPEVHMTAEDTKDFDDTCAVCFVMNKCISSDDIICSVDTVDLQVVRNSEPLPTNVQPPLMEEKSLLNQEALDSMTPADKSHFVHHINTEDENVLELLGDFNFSNLVECTEDEINEFLECTNPCDACLDTEVVDVLILVESTEKDCALADGFDIVLEVIQEEEEHMLPILQVGTASGEEDDVILPSLKLQRVQPPLFKVKHISLIPSSPLATPSIIIGTFESNLYQPPPPPNLHFIPSPTPTRPSTLARLYSLKPPPLDNPQTVNHIRSSMMNKFLSSIYTLESTIIHSWKKLYHFTRPPDLPQFHPLFQGFFIIIFLLHSLPRYCMLWLDAPTDSVSTPPWMKSVL